MPPSPPSPQQPWNQGNQPDKEPAVEPGPPIDPELEQVIAWRYVQLQVAGWDEPEAHTLARHLDVDLHLACELVQGGVDQTTALRILL